jgi:general secretion pathway protein C
LDAHNPQTYVAGAILTNGARLVEIYSDYVVLERGAESVRLYAQRNQAAESSSLSPLLQATTALPKLATQSAAPTSDAQADATMSITDFIRPNPVIDHEQLQGFQLNPGRQSAAFSRLGLASGDVLTGIDGAPVTDAYQVMDALAQVLAGGTLEVTVERGGHRQPLTLDGSAIAPGN